MTFNSIWIGTPLEDAIREQPALSLDFYSYGIMLRKRDGDRQTEYPVDPAQVATVLAAKITLDTGILSDDTLLVRQEGVKKTVVGYRKGRWTGVYLEETADAMRLPLPPLVMIRTTRDNRDPTYTVYAVKHKPQSLDLELFHAPLPNVFNSGSICWGSVPQVSEEALTGSSLAADFAMLLGSAFGNHACTGKSRAFPQDIRQQLILLDKRAARRYPTSDLVSAKRTLGQVLGGGS